MWKRITLAMGTLGMVGVPTAVLAQTAATLSQAPAQSPPQTPVYPGYGCCGMMGGWGPGYGYGMGPGMMGYGMWLGGLFWLLVLIAIVVVVVLLVRGSVSARPGHAEPDGKNALKLLNERYARGEIEREEYLEKKRDLGG